MSEKVRYPAGIPYIIGNEACERFCYYGMRAVLWAHMVSLFSSELAAKAAEDKATSRIHLFFAGVYAFPMIGALCADRLLGKYRTIFWLSLVYVAGCAIMALFNQDETRLYVGLALIAVGSGGIKPCVSAQVGDQFTASNQSLLSKVYQAFYFSINFGSLFSYILTPWLMRAYGPGWAFGVPGILMAAATFLMWAGRNKYIRLAPKPGGRLGLLDAAGSIALFLTVGSLFFTSHSALAVKLGVALACFLVFLGLFTLRQRIAPDPGFFAVVLHALTHQRDRKPGQGFFDVARAKYGDEAAEGPAAVLRVAVVFSMVSVFWALFDQKASSWVNQASKMDLAVDLPLLGHLQLEPPMIGALNPAMVMLIIPFLNLVVYPFLERRGLKLPPLRRMTAGMVLAAIAFALVALIQARIEALAAAGAKLSVLWQVAPYLVMTTAEVLVSATGLEFAYTQAPRNMKSTVTGFWLLTVTLGNLLVAGLAGFAKLALVEFFWTFSGLMLIAAFLFGILAFFYKGKTYLVTE